MKILSCDQLSYTTTCITNIQIHALVLVFVVIEMLEILKDS